MKVFEESFISAVKEEIARQLAASGSATRKTVCDALGLEGFEACISVLLEQGSLPDYRAVKRLGIVAADYQTGKQKKEQKKESKPINVLIHQPDVLVHQPDVLVQPEPRKLHPNVLARQQVAIN